MSKRITHELDKMPFQERILIPPGLLEGLRMYLEDGIETGGFMRAVLENDLKGVIKRASPDSLRALPLLINVLLGYVPLKAWGSPEAVAAWLDND